MNKQYLVLWLEAPLQSWGSNSKFGVRNTMPFPTKSGVYGILLSSLGASGPQEELLAKLSGCEQTIISYVPKVPNRRKEEHGIQKPIHSPLLMDFQMVGSGYNDKDNFENLLIPRKKDGTKAVGGGAKMTYRYYLQDSYFAVIQEIPDELVEPLKESLMSPTYDLFLGRKNCIPTDFLYRGYFSTIDEASSTIAKIAEEKSLIQDFTVFDREVKDAEELFVLSDVPIIFGERKVYKERIASLVKHYE